MINLILILALILMTRTPFTTNQLSPKRCLSKIFLNSQNTDLWTMLIKKRTRNKVKGRLGTDLTFFKPKEIVQDIVLHKIHKITDKILFLVSEMIVM